MVTRSVADSLSSESIRQHRSISAMTQLGSLQDDELHGRITRVSKAEAIGSAAERKKATVGFNGPNEPLE